MKSKGEILMIYFGIVIGIYLWGNIIVGNLMADTERDKGRIQILKNQY